jgi:threonine 3-dehydrogenase
MKALYEGVAGPALTLTERPEPTPGSQDVKIRVARTGICGTDLHIESWDSWAAGAINAPLIPGHEIVGQVGAEVSTVEVGDLVSGEGHVVCGNCRNRPAGLRPYASSHRARASTGTAHSPTTSSCQKATYGATCRIWTLI